MLLTACPEVTETLAKIVPYWNIIQVKLCFGTLKHSCKLYFFYKGLIWKYCTSFERPWRISLLFSDHYAWRFSQSWTDRFYPTFQMGHCYNVLTKQRSTFFGCERSSYSIRKVKNLMHSLDNIWWGKFYSSATSTVMTFNTFLIFTISCLTSFLPNK